MRNRIVVGIVLIALFVGSSISNASQLSLLEESPVYPYPGECLADWDELGCIYVEECLCYVSPLSLPSTSTDEPTSETNPFLPQDSASNENIISYACFMAARWWGFDGSICIGGY